jgi:predicted lipoprotein with Yx(FWY)xxD motif
MKKITFGSMLVIVALLLSSCQFHTGLGSLLGANKSSSSASGAPTKHIKATHTAPASGSSSGSQTPAAPVNTPTGPTTIDTAANAKYGTILTDANGRTLYLFLNDTSTTSTCADTCATNWPAVLTNGNAVAGSGVDASKLGTTTRTDGSVQVTYNGHPLYYFAQDKAAGDVKGQGIKNVWYVVSATGDSVKQ